MGVDNVVINRADRLKNDQPDNNYYSCKHILILLYFLKIKKGGYGQPPLPELGGVIIGLLQTGIPFLKSSARASGSPPLSNNAIASSGERTISFFSSISSPFNF